MGRVRTKTVGLGLLGILVLALAGFGAWIASLPPSQETAVPSPIDPVETAATLAALKPAGTGRPVVAIVGINDATETTDYMMPYGILKRADVADVVTLATGPGPVHLYPALSVMPDATVAEFNADHPDGADYVIVPAMSREDDPVVLAWLREQAGKGATIIGVCVGVKVVAAAGLLDGRRATTHWYSRDDLLKEHPAVRYVPDRRFLIDGGVMTTTGITASMPAMLTLIEAIGGPEKAREVAADLGLQSWDARHDSSAFGLTRPFVSTVLRNRGLHWGTEDMALALRPGVDEVSLALVADAWSRTYRSRAVSHSATVSPTVTANGMRVIPDVVRAAPDLDSPKIGLQGDRPVAALEAALDRISARYGPATAEIVAMQLEYPESNFGRRRFSQNPE